MFDAMRRGTPNWPLSHLLWWRFLRSLCCIALHACFKVRAWGHHNVPDTGPVLYLSNHQSYLDPILIGVCLLHRTFNSMARDSLFYNPMFGWIIRSLHAIPIVRGASDMAAMRSCIEAMNKGQSLMIFPEGTRTRDGSLGEFKSGPLLIIKRAKPTIMPVAIQGAHKAWPRGGYPHPRKTIGVMFGKPIPGDVFARNGAASMKELRNQIAEMQFELAERLERGAAGVVE